MDSEAGMQPTASLSLLNEGVQAEELSLGAELNVVQLQLYAPSFNHLPEMMQCSLDSEQQPVEAEALIGDVFLKEAFSRQSVVVHNALI